MVIEFAQDTGLAVAGALYAVGEEQKPIIFTGEQETKGYWKGISFEYTDMNRDQIDHFNHYRDLIAYLEKQNLLEQFIDYAREKGIPRDSEGLKESGEIIHTQILAYISRNLFDNDGFFPIVHAIDNTMNKAISYL